MRITLGSNIASLTAQRRLGEATADLSQTYQRLSSGMRINSGSDDAAGLAIADRLRVDARISNQAVRNLNDGISLFAIAESAIGGLNTILTRIEELAEQAANGVYSSKQRTALDTEAQQLWAEYSRIVESTKFNGIKLLDGSSAAVAFQAGSGTDAVLIGGIESVASSSSQAQSFTATGDFLAATHITVPSGTADGIELADLNGDGNADAVLADEDGISIYIGDGQGSFSAGQRYAASTGINWDISIGDLNGDGELDIVSVGQDVGNNGSATVLLGNGNGTFNSLGSFATETEVSWSVTLADLSGDGVLDLITSGRNDGGASGGKLSLYTGVGDGSFIFEDRINADSFHSRAVEVGYLDGDGIWDIVTAGYTGVDGTATVFMDDGSITTYNMDTGSTYAVKLADLNEDGILDMVSGGSSDANVATATVRLGNGNGTFGARTSYAQTSGAFLSVELADLNGDGNIDFSGTNYNGGVAVAFGDGNGAFGSFTNYVSTNESTGHALYDINSDGVLDILSVGDIAGTTKLTINLAESIAGDAEVASFSLLSVTDARSGLTTVRDRRESLSIKLGKIGAFVSRLEVASNTLEANTVRLKEAESRIRDVDIASESAKLTRLQILQQASTAVLAQANQQPQLALKVLSNI